MFLFHQLRKRHNLQYPQIRDVAMRISGHVAQGVRSPSQSPKPNNNTSDQEPSTQVHPKNTLTGSNAEPIAKKKKEVKVKVTFPGPVSVSVKKSENTSVSEELAVSHNAENSSPAIVKSPSKVAEKTPESTESPNESDGFPSKTDGKPSPDKTRSAERFHSLASPVDKVNDENLNGLNPIKTIDLGTVEQTEVEKWKNNYKELQEKSREVALRLRNEVQAMESKVAEKEATIAVRDESMKEMEAKNENLETVLEEAKGKANDAVSQCKLLFNKSQEDSKNIKERDAKIEELEQRLAGKLTSEQVIIKKEVGVEEKENARLRKENSELIKRLRILEVFNLIGSEPLRLASCFRINTMERRG